MPRRPVTSRVRAASRRNIIKAQLSRVRRREPRQVGRIRAARRPQQLRSRIR